MGSYRYDRENTPPPAQPVTDVAITRFDHVLEVEPSLMTENVSQQNLANWDTLRIVSSRHDHLAWMHRHWAQLVVSGEELLRELDDDPTSPPARRERGAGEPQP